MCPLPVTACTSRYSVLEVFLVCFHGLIQTYQVPARGGGVGVSGLTLLPAEQTSQLQQVSRRVRAVPKDGDFPPLRAPSWGCPIHMGRGCNLMSIWAFLSLQLCPLALVLLL